MKRILNLNEFAGPALKVIATLGLGLPALLYLASRVLDGAGLHLPLLERIARMLLGTGGVLLLLFIILVVVEQIQDHLLYRRYLQERSKQILDECPYCGNRQLRPLDHFCPVCGEQIRREG